MLGNFSTFSRQYLGLKINQNKTTLIIFYVYYNCSFAQNLNHWLLRKSESFSMTTKILFSKFPLGEEVASFLHLVHPRVKNHQVPPTCTSMFSFFRFTHLWETNDHHYLPIQRPSIPQADAVFIVLQSWHEGFGQLFLKLNIATSWKSFKTHSPPRGPRKLCAMVTFVLNSFASSFLPTSFNFSGRLFWNTEIRRFTASSSAFVSSMSGWHWRTFFSKTIFPLWNTDQKGKPTGNC